MKHLSIILISYFIASCGTKTVHTQDETAETTVVAETDTAEDETIVLRSTVDLMFWQLSRKVFEVGEISHFTDTCTFYFACDCCSGDLIFNGDSSFYYKNYCLGDQDLFLGRYYVADSTVTLRFSGRHILKAYNWENEVDTNQVDYMWTDSIAAPFVLKYFADSCGQKLSLAESKGLEYAIETESDYMIVVEALGQEGFFNYFETKKQPPTKPKAN